MRDFFTNFGTVESKLTGNEAERERIKIKIKIKIKSTTRP